MYNGEDVPWLISHLTDASMPSGAVAAVGPRHRGVAAAQVPEARALALLSSIGSHTLSLLYLALYGRYVSDTLSGARACASPTPRRFRWA
jgi:hypothetical protein